MKNGNIASEQLRSIVERIERLEEEKSELSADIREVFAEAQGNGFDAKTIRQIIKLRKLTPAQRDEQDALLDIYKAALGMLGDTPLGEAAIRRLSDLPARPPEADEPEKTEPAEGEETTDEAPKKGKKINIPEIEPEPTPEPGPSIDEAREMGRQAAIDGKPVTTNPFPARDPRRPAWDEEWCKSAGSDGMELPDAWRRTVKKKGDGDDKEA